MKKEKKEKKVKVTKQKRRSSIRVKIVVPTLILAILLITSAVCNYASTAVMMNASNKISEKYAQNISNLGKLSASFESMQKIIYDNTGVWTTLMRFPGGSSNTVSIRSCEGIMTFLTKAVQDAGFQFFDWNVDSGDTVDARKKHLVIANVKQRVEEAGIAMVLQHDIHSFSVDAVEDIIRWGLDNGYTFLPLTENTPGFHQPVNN